MSQDSTPALDLAGVSKRYGGFQAVYPVNLSVNRGSTYGLLGPNGAGKTTIIRMSLRIIESDTGQVSILGRKQSQEGLDRIGYLPEERGVYRRMKVRALLMFFAELKGLKARDVRSRIDGWLERLDLSSRADAKVMELSKGMQQKVQFISAILHEPEIVILDEPFSGLDPINQRVLREIINELKAKGRTIIFSTHIIEHAERICDHVGIIARGVKVADGSIAQVKHEHGSRYIALRVADGAAAAADIRKIGGVERVKQTDGELEISLVSGGDPQSLLQTLVSNGMRLDRFEVAETSLEQIFIERVAAREAELTGEATHV